MLYRTKQNSVVTAKVIFSPPKEYNKRPVYIDVANNVINKKHARERILQKWNVSLIKKQYITIYAYNQPIRNYDLCVNNDIADFNCKTTTNKTYCHYKYYG